MGGHLRAKRIRRDRSYFSAAKFRAWLGRESETRSALRVGVSRSHLRRLRSGEQSPTLETYLRMCATAGVPVGTWLAHLKPSSNGDGSA